MPFKATMRFASEHAAARASDNLADMPDLEGCTFVVWEDHQGWVLDCYETGEVTEEFDWNAFLEEAGVTVLTPVTRDRIPDVDWVSLTQQGLSPVIAGRFVICGNHDRSRIHSKWAIEIDAGRAFGTAHHGSTRGCLLALDRNLRRCDQKRILDIGTGTGVLAIAALKATGRNSIALVTDKDAVAIEVARNNCQLNGVLPLVTFDVSDGQTGFPLQYFDLVTANILAGPLIALSSKIRHALRKGGLVVLSGFLPTQKREVVAAYLSRGFAKVEISDTDGWTTAVLRRML